MAVQLRLKPFLISFEAKNEDETFAFVTYKNSPSLFQEEVMLIIQYSKIAEA